MSDVILYAAIIERDRLKDATAGGTTALDYSLPTPGGYPYVSGAGDAAGEFNSCPQIVKDWITGLTPLVCPAQTYGFKVCGSCWRCGTNCNTTICSGVSNIQIQMWGPGGGTSGNCCCGGSPFGPSGAYMVTQFCVNQGETYCLCAGCAYCCWGEQTTPGICGSPTWFNSTSGINACTDSGISCFCYWNEDLKSNTSTCGHRIPDPDQAGGTCSANRCSGWNFCYDDYWDESLACHAFASRTTFHLNNGASDGRTVTKYGLNGLWPAHCTGGSGNCLHGSTGYSTPVFGFESCVCDATYTGADQNEGLRGCYYNGANGYLRIPGAGGYHTYSCGGGNGCQGDSGRFGMVCVSWECD
jgi:hypothetical protein